MKRISGCFWLSVLLLVAACTTYRPSGKVVSQNYRIGTMPGADSGLVRLLRPYSDSVNRTMNTWIAHLETDLEKKQPEGTLGNLMADALLVMAEKEFGVRPDAAFMNNGGIRVNSMKAGPVTTGEVYELFPFDNMLVLLQLKGDVLQQFLDHISGRGGWPVAGMTMQISNRKAVNVRIGGAAIDPQKTYTIALGDYTANGGDDAAMLKGIPQMNRGYLMRDAFIAYFASFAKAGKNISVKPENRVSYAQ